MPHDWIALKNLQTPNPLVPLPDIGKDNRKRGFMRRVVVVMKAAMSLSLGMLFDR